MNSQPQGVLPFSRPNAAQDKSPSVLALHSAAKQLAQQSLGRPRLKTKDIVGYLLGHGARVWRGSFPVASPRVKVMMPNGNFAVKIKLS
ncbi:MAG: hypothetical protein ACRCT6_10370 [Notoacmeibacter sp.]